MGITLLLLVAGLQCSPCSKQYAECMLQWEPEETEREYERRYEKCQEEYKKCEEKSCGTKARSRKT